MSEYGDRLIKKAQLPVLIAPGGGGDDVFHLIEQAQLPAPAGKQLPQLLGLGAGAVVTGAVALAVPLPHPRKGPVQTVEEVVPLAVPHGNTEGGVDKPGPRPGGAVHH